MKFTLDLDSEFCAQFLAKKTKFIRSNLGSAPLPETRPLSGQGETFNFSPAVIDITVINSCPGLVLAILSFFNSPFCQPRCRLSWIFKLESLLRTQSFIIFFFSGKSFFKCSDTTLLVILSYHRAATFLDCHFTDSLI